MLHCWVAERDGLGVRVSDTREAAQATTSDGQEYPQRAAVGMGLAYWAGVTPQRQAISSPKGSRTFAQLNERANALARGLRRRDLNGGDGVALLCSNRPEFVEVFAASERAGFRLIPVSWHLTSDEIGYIIKDSGARAVIAGAEFAASMPESVGGVGVRLAIGGDIEGFERYEAVIAAEDVTDVTDPVRGTTMLYTSGTTGRPKGVFREQPPSVSSANVGVYDYRHETDSHLCTGPLYHAAPLAFSLIVPLLAGVRVVLMQTWDAAAALTLIEQERITHTHLVPTMFHRLLSLPASVRAAADVSSLRFVIHGAAPCPVTVKQAMMDWLGPIIWEYYAATEGVGTLCDPATWLAHPGTVGKALVPGGLLVGDHDARPVPPETVGTVWLKAPEEGRFRYWGDHAKTVGTYRGDYFTLGDVGRMNADGFLYLTDRSADLIISGGVNVYPAEVDGVLLDHPAVADVGTIGVADLEWGEEVLSVVELVAGVEPDALLAQELINWCRTRLARYKCPRRIEFIDHLPRTPAGKLPRQTLREQYRPNGVATPATGAPSPPTSWDI